MSAVLYIKHSKLGRELSDEELKKLSTIVKTKSFKKGEVIFHEKSSSDSLIIIKKGKAILKIETEKGGIDFGVVKEGDHFGELALGRTSTRLVTAEAIEDCEVFMISAADFDDFAKKEPFIACKVLKNALAIFSEKLKEVISALLKEVDF